MGTIFGTCRHKPTTLSWQDKKGANRKAEKERAIDQGQETLQETRILHNSTETNQKAKAKAKAKAQAKAKAKAKVIRTVWLKVATKTQAISAFVIVALKRV
jgi:hypothetical protein